MLNFAIPAGATGARLLLASALLLSGAPSAFAAALDAVPAANADADNGAEVITVTARNRDEDIRNVPIPITVLNSETIDRQQAFTIADLTQHAPSLTATTPNARRTGVSLRGIGRTSGNDNMEAAVGVIVDDVFLDHVGMTYQDFTDLQQVEILRGPQGTLLGKNTSLGVIKYTSKAPSFKRDASLEVEGGLSTPAFKARGSYSDALIGDVLAIRASGFYDSQQGDLRNINPAVGGYWHEHNRWGGRLQLLLNATDKLSFRLNLDAAETHENSNTKPFMVDPATLNDGSVRTTTYTTRLARSYFGGYTPVIGSWNTIDMDQALPLITRNWGGSLVGTWDVGPFEVKSISALRKLHFDASNDSDQTHFAINRGGTLVDSEQWSEELRLAGKLGNSLQYQGGLYFFRINTNTTSRTLYGQDAGAFYATNAQYTTLNSPTGWALLQKSLANVASSTWQDPISTSQAAFTQADWTPIERLTITAGVRYTREQKHSITSKSASYADGSALVTTGNATADAIRSAQLTNSYTNILGTPIYADSVAWLANPSYKVSETVLAYASASGGGKSGAVAFDSSGNRRNVAPEKTNDFELGVKSQLFAKRLSLDVNLFYTKVRNYQATTSIVDTTSSTGYSSVLGNIPGIRARGVEWEGSLLAAKGLTLTFAGAYNDAVYTSWSTATCPKSYPSTVVVCNNTGKQIVGAPRWTVVFGFNFEHELPGTNLKLVAFANDTYRTAQNLEQSLSPYGWQTAYHLTDAGIGVNTRLHGVKTEISVIAKNLFDVHYTTSVNDFSNNSPVGYDGIGARRYVGLVAKAKI